MDQIAEDNSVTNLDHKDCREISIVIKELQKENQEIKLAIKSWLNMMDGIIDMDNPVDEGLVKLKLDKLRLVSK